MHDLGHFGVAELLDADQQQRLALLGGEMVQRGQQVDALADALSGIDRTTATPDAELHRVVDAAAVDPTERMGQRIDLLAALHHLTAEQREPLLLVCVEQLSYAEVAEVMHVPVGTVMSRVFRARARLRGILDARSAAPVLRRVI